MTLVPRIVFALALASCAVASFATDGSAAEVTRRLCDRRLTYDIVPPVDVPPSLSILSGVWTGTIIMAGGSAMCVSMVVKAVFADCRVTLAMPRNASIGGREDTNNFAGLGEAPNWPN